MQTNITLMLEYRGDSGQWHVGAVAKTDGDYDLAAAEACSPFASWPDVQAWAQQLLHAWACPEIGVAPTESLHEVWAKHP